MGDEIDEFRGPADAQGYRYGDRKPKVDRGDLNRRGMKKSEVGPPIWFLPPAIKNLFNPRPPIEAKPPLVVEEPGRPSTLTGIAALLPQLETTAPPARPDALDQGSVAIRRRSERVEQAKARVDKLKTTWDPNTDPKATGDAFATLFVGRLNHNTTEATLKKSFGDFGPIVNVRLVRDLAGKSRGYAFIQYEDEEDVKKAYRRGEGLVVDGHRVVLDVERGRTVRGWVPRRLGGGLGNTRDTRSKAKKDRKAERIYPPLGKFSVVVPPALESSTGPEAVKKRHLAIADQRVRANQEAMRRAALEKSGGAGAAAAAAAGGVARGAPAGYGAPPGYGAPSGDGAYSRSGLGMGYGGGRPSGAPSGGYGGSSGGHRDDRYDRRDDRRDDRYDRRDDRYRDERRYDDRRRSRSRSHGRDRHRDRSGSRGRY